MAKKGIILTIGILAAITIASFLVWLVPNYNQATFVVSDYENNLNNVKQIHTTITFAIEEEFQNLLNDSITPQDYINIAETSSSQINSQIIQLVNSNPPEHWQPSYGKYIESLQKTNSYIRQTIVVANMIKDGASQNEINNTLENINQLKADYELSAQESDELRP